jgi:hypothetical protein
LKFAANFSVKPAFASCASWNEENFPIPQKNSEGSKSNHVLVPLSRPSQTSLRLRDDRAGRKQDHFTPYESSALKRLMGRYATREDEIGRMLRAKLFIDLHTVLKRAVRAVVEQYSLKVLELFHGFERTVPSTRSFATCSMK